MQTQPRLPALPNKSLFAMNRWFYKMHLAGLLYHPDDPAETIINLANSQPTFTPEECVELNHAVDLMFDHHGDKVYDVCLHCLHKAMGNKPEYSEA